jgi:hypothetical protein
MGESSNISRGGRAQILQLSRDRSDKGSVAAVARSVGKDRDVSSSRRVVGDNRATGAAAFEATQLSYESGKATLD